MPARHPIRTAALILAVVALVAVAIATADPEPAADPAPAGDPTPAAASRPTVPPRDTTAPRAAPTDRDTPPLPPDLAINQAEREAGVPADPDKARELAQRHADQLAGAAADRSAEAPAHIAAIRATLAGARAEVATLAGRLAATADPAARDALQREIAARKQQAELDVLDIQRRHAAQRGDQDLAAELEAAIASILTPPEPTPPARPRPQPGGQR